MCWVNQRVKVNLAPKNSLRPMKTVLYLVLTKHLQLELAGLAELHVFTVFAAGTGGSVLSK